MESAFDKCVLSRGTLTGRRGRDSAIWPRMKKGMYQKFECCNSSGSYVCWIPKASGILVKAVNMENPCSPRQSSMGRKLHRVIWTQGTQYRTSTSIFQKGEPYCSQKCFRRSGEGSYQKNPHFAIIYCRGQSWTHSETSKKTGPGKKRGKDRGRHMRFGRHLPPQG